MQKQQFQDGYIIQQGLAEYSCLWRKYRRLNILDTLGYKHVLSTKEDPV